MKEAALDRNNGFTLIELLVAMAIVATLAGIAIPNFFSWLPDIRMKAAARDLFSKLQEIRLLAIKENANYSIAFNVATNCYSLRNDWGNDNLPNTNDPGEGDGVNSIAETFQTISFTDYGSGVAFGAGAATDDVSGSGWADGPMTYVPAEVRFNPKGIASRNGYVYITNQNNVECMAVGTLTSGAVRMLRSFGGNVWK